MSESTLPPNTNYDTPANNVQLRYWIESGLVRKIVIDTVDPIIIRVSEITFQNCLIRNLKLRKSSVKKYIFEGCIIENDITISDNENRCEVHFKNCTGNINAIQLTNSNVHTLEVTNSQKIESIHLEDEQKDLNNLTIIGCAIKKLVVKKPSIKLISVSYCDLNNTTVICNKLDMFRLVGESQRTMTFGIIAINVKDDLNHFSLLHSYGDRLLLTANKTQTIHIENSSVKEEFDIHSSFVTFRLGTMNKDITHFGRVILKPSTVELQPNTVFVEKSILHSFLFHFKSANHFQVRECRITDELDISNVNFERTIFSNIGLRTAVLRIHNTNFGDMNLEKVEWATDNKAYEFSSKEYRKDQENFPENYIYELTTLQESYRDLRNYFAERKNDFDSMLFATNEMRIEEMIKRTEMRYISFWRYFGDWFVLWTNRFFSNFGLSWLRPLLIWLGIVHLVLFYLILINFDLGIAPFFDLLNFEFHSIDIKSTKKGLDLYLQLLLPVHDADVNKVFDEYGEAAKPKTVNIWGVIDFFMRIFSSYFIFLIIRGTRKFNFNVK